VTPKEQRIELIKNSIAESKRARGGSRQVGPVMVISFGIVLLLTPMMGFSDGFVGLGVITVLLAMVWAYSKSRDATQLKKEIYQYEWDLYTIERDLEKGNMKTL